MTFVYETKVKSYYEEYLDFLKASLSAGEITEEQYQAKVKEANTSALEMKRPVNKPSMMIEKLAEIFSLDA